MKNKIITGAIIGAIVIGGGSFYGGMKYAEGQTVQGFRAGNFANVQQNGNRAGRFSGAANAAFDGSGGRGGFTTGKIISKDDKSITVTLPDGGSRIVFLADTTDVVKTASSTISDIAVGDTVMVNGPLNQDGSMTAHTIELR